MIALQKGETILMEVRKHWIVVLVHTFFFLAVAFIPLAVVPIAMQYLFPNLAADVGSTVLGSMYLFVTAAWLLFVWVMFFVAWTNYYLDVLVITNKRIIDVEQFVLFSRDEVTIPLNSIEDIKIEVLGFLATLLKFGNLQIQTAGAQRETVTTKIRRPELVRSCLESAVERSKLQK